MLLTSPAKQAVVLKHMHSNAFTCDDLTKNPETILWLKLQNTAQRKTRRNFFKSKKM